MAKQCIKAKSPTWYSPDYHATPLARSLACPSPYAAGSVAAVHQSAASLDQCFWEHFKRNWTQGAELHKR